MGEPTPGQELAAEIWVTMLSCSECTRHHDEDDPPLFGCDCWCHDGDMDEDDGDA